MHLQTCDPYAINLILWYPRELICGVIPNQKYQTVQLSRDTDKEQEYENAYLHEISNAERIQVQRAF